MISQNNTTSNNNFPFYKNKNETLVINIHDHWAKSDTGQQGTTYDKGSDPIKENKSFRLYWLFYEGKLKDKKNTQCSISKVHYVKLVAH